MDVSQFLTHEHVAFSVIPHRRTETTQHLAEEVHVSGDHVAKSVLLRTPPNFSLAVLPASFRIAYADYERRERPQVLDLATHE